MRSLNISKCWTPEFWKLYRATLTTIKISIAQICKYDQMRFTWSSIETLYTILGRQRDDDGQNKLLQINGSKDNSSYIINCMNLIQS
jgi:hypothetical protein